MRDVANVHSNPLLIYFLASGTVALKLCAIRQGPVASSAQ